MTGQEVESLRNELKAELELHRRQTDFQFSGIERWIQTASTALDKVVELQIQISTARESQLMDRGMNEQFRKDLQTDLKNLQQEVATVKTKTQEVAIRVTLIIGAGMTFINVALWALGRFL